jgi:flagellar basal body P-ring formation protein FlgA
METTRLLSIARTLKVLACSTAWLLASFAHAAETLHILPAAQVDRSGIFLHQLVQPGAAVMPQIRLAEAPALNQSVVFTRAQLDSLMKEHAQALLPIHWAGAPQVRVTRRTRELHESELKEMLTRVLQETVGDRGELDLRLSRPWTAVLVPDEPLSMKVSDLPATGVSAHFLARIELFAGDERAGSWQVVAQAKLWRDVPVAQKPLRRGQLLRDADIALERRDALTIRDALRMEALDEPSLEFVENISAGMPLLARSVRVRPLVRRGKMVEAHLQDGALNISLRVEALEDGWAGQLIRVRNLKSKREFYAKVQDEQTVQVSL